MFVARVVVSGSRRESWTVVGEDGLLVGPAERFLSFLTDSGRSPNTIKAYAYDLRDWFEFLTGRGLDWTAVTVEESTSSQTRSDTRIRDDAVQSWPELK